MAVATALTKPVNRAFQPRSVPAGQRVRAGKKKHKDKPKVGRGQYVKAPLLRDKLTQPRWMANAAVNNPGNLLAAGGIGAGTGLVAGHREKVKKDDDRRKRAAGGALVGAGAAHYSRVGADYGTKALAERQFKPLTTKGNYGPYHEGPHKPALNKYKRTVKGDVRQKAKMFDEHFPKGIPSYRARKAGVLLNKKPVAAGIAAAGAVTGAGLAQRRKKMNVKKAYDFAPGTSKKKKTAYQAGAITGVAASATGGSLYGQMAGEHHAIHGGGVKGIGRSAKFAAKSPVGRVGLGLAAAGIGGNAAMSHHAKKKGTLIKKNTTASAFGVEHGS